VAVTRHQRTRVATRVHARKRVRSANLGARWRIRAKLGGSLAVLGGGRVRSRSKRRCQQAGTCKSHIHMHTRMRTGSWRSRGTNARASQRACTRASACARQTCESAGVQIWLLTATPRESLTSLLHSHQPRSLVSMRHQRTHDSTHVHAHKRMRSVNLGARSRTLTAAAAGGRSQNLGPSKVEPESYVQTSPMTCRV
jgi:hypothetical protein